MIAHIIREILISAVAAVLLTKIAIALIVIKLDRKSRPIDASIYAKTTGLQIRKLRHIDFLLTIAVLAGIVAYGLLILL